MKKNEYKIIVYCNDKELLSCTDSKKQFDDYSTFLENMKESKNNPDPKILTLKIVNYDLLILNFKKEYHNDGATLSIYTIPKSSKQLSKKCEL